VTVRRDTRLRAATALLLAPALLGACTSTGDGTGPQPSPAPVATGPASPTASAAGHHVEIIVTTPSTEALDISYGIGAGPANFHHVTGVTSPWTVKQDTPAYVALIDLGAAVDGNPLPVTCVLVFDGKVVDQNTGSGAIGCHYVPPVSAG
jgi:hypothetical protein